MYRTRNTDYLKKLADSGKRIFKTADVAIIWGISDKNKLHTYLKRYTKKTLYRLAKGLYSIIDPAKLHPYELGVALAGDLSYVSLETVLFNHGKINQPVYKITLVGKKNKEFSFGQHDYLCRYLSIKRLVDRQGIIDKDGYPIADADRAMADIRLIKSHYYTDKSL